MTGPAAGAPPDARRLAQRLHDTVLQSLAVARIRIDQALARSGPLPRDLGEDLRRLLDEEIAGLRALVHGTAHPAPASPDLRGALAATAEQVRSAGIRCRVEDRTAPGRAWTRTDLVAYPILREAVHNAVKHSGAGHIRVTVTRTAGRLVCEVRDDGHGFDPATTPMGFGTTGMRAQAEDAGGELVVDSRPSGTLVTLVLPDRTTYGDPALEGDTGDDHARLRGTTDDRHLRRPPGRTLRDPHSPGGRAVPDRR